MANELATMTGTALEQVVIGGDLKSLTPPQRVEYYAKVCESVGLNPLTKPFDYITLNGKLTLYARKDAADQLRKIHGISITSLDTEIINDVYCVTAVAMSRDGRTDIDTGAVNIKGMSGDNLANAMMKARTKAKRRVTLSIAGLGWLDETELETIQSAQPVIVSQETGEVITATGNGKSNGNGHSAPAPVAELPAVVAEWQTPDDAFMWAIGAGAVDGGVPHAKNLLKKIAEPFGGLKKSNAAEVYTAFYHECLKRAADAEQQAAAAHDDDEVGNLFEEVAEMAA